MEAIEEIVYSLSSKEWWLIFAQHECSVKIGSNLGRTLPLPNLAVNVPTLTVDVPSLAEEIYLDWLLISLRE
ncbi:hypothetical protein [Vibrio owensii]|uniref:Uncharacterized protein n=1 Tax=Vibrio owensii CAIM 1854 = LMG 25443 TaxID=1229493 RepID=A0A0C1Z9B7_9VIBR|nr:hypothetical protein [Vibrio owensii]KIF52749.1 hypothetical protein H735_12650 [Vibrio owensii CAIM 1854 = LMG 25443]